MMRKGNLPLIITHSELGITAQVELIYSGEQVSPALLGTSSVMLELEFNESPFESNSWKNSANVPTSNQSTISLPIEKLTVKEYVLDNDSTIANIQVTEKEREEATQISHTAKKLCIDIYGSFPKA